MARIKQAYYLFCCIMCAFTKLELKKLTHSLQKGPIKFQ